MAQGRISPRIFMVRNSGLTLDFLEMVLGVLELILHRMPRIAMDIDMPFRMAVVACFLHVCCRVTLLNLEVMGT